MSRNDNIQQLVLDHSGSDFSAAANLVAARADVTAQTALLDCLGLSEVDILVDFTNLGAGPVTKVSVAARYSGIAAPNVATATEWSSVNVEDVDTTTGISTVVPYVAEMAVAATGIVVITVPVKTRYVSALVWVDSAVGSRGKVFFYRRDA